MPWVVLAIAAAALGLAWMVLRLARSAPLGRESLAHRIDALLPQTQCGRCGYAGCRPYAEAIAHGTADINRCAPGGEAGIVKLATLLQRAVRPIDPDCGPIAPKRVALIDESACIGCTLCIQACPVDAIVGAAKQMHTVIARWCTGCELCLPPCPVDCIALIEPGHRAQAPITSVVREERKAA